MVFVLGEFTRIPYCTTLEFKKNSVQLMDASGLISIPKSGGEMARSSFYHLSLVSQCCDCSLKKRTCYKIAQIKQKTTDGHMQLTAQAASSHH